MNFPRIHIVQQRSVGFVLLLWRFSQKPIGYINSDLLIFCAELMALLDRWLEIDVPDSATVH